MAGAKSRWRIGCRGADVIWLERREERVAQSKWRQDRVDFDRMYAAMAPMRRKEARRCQRCGNLNGCDCGPEPIAWLSDDES